MSSVITQEMKSLAFECETLYSRAMTAGRTEEAIKLSKLQAMIYSGKVAFSEIRKCMNAIGMALLRPPSKSDE